MVLGLFRTVPLQKYVYNDYYIQYLSVILGSLFVVFLLLIGLLSFILSETWSGQGQMGQPNRLIQEVNIPQTSIHQIIHADLQEPI